MGLEDGLPTNSAVNLDHMQTVAKNKIGKQVTLLSSRRMEQVREALLFALGFPS